LDAVLIDYQRNVPAAREPEVLSTMAIIVNKLGGHITAEIPQIFDAVFECTLNMINKVCDLYFNYIWPIFFCFVVLEFELGACLLGRHSYCLSHSASTF
jgi:hypothetical protein